MNPSPEVRNLDSSPGFPTHWQCDSGQVPCLLCVTVSPPVTREFELIGLKDLLSPPGTSHLALTFLC